MSDLKEVELLLLNTLIDGNLEKFGFLKLHLDFIKIESRKTSNKGLYINFSYIKEFDDDEFVNALISAEEKLISPDLKNELTYCLDITNGRMDFLEIATNGNEIWNNNLENCTLISEQS